MSEPLWELHTTTALNGATALLRDLVAVETQNERLLRYRTADADGCNPEVLRRLHGAGVAVVALSPVPQSLENEIGRAHV